MARHSRQVSFMWYWRKRLASKAHSAHDTVKSRYSEPQVNDFFRLKTISKIPLEMSIGSM